ncbi:MAG: PIN domain-containing protein, partial [Candidatus Dormibacteraeota bacterium]|nr:PIN domain-containing protein [Candidatus Dormibacteraeota bacterium]
MSAERITYLDASALVKLVDREPESPALRRFLRGKRPLFASALVRTEVMRAVVPLGPRLARRARDVLAIVELIRVTERILSVAGTLQ